MPTERALALIARAPVVHLATTMPDGALVLRPIHAVVIDGVLAFHGAQTGEKASCVGRAAVVAASELHAIVPSWFLDSENAAGAGTLYESAEIHGTLEVVESPEAKVRVLHELMRKYQPEGRFRLMDAADPLYAHTIEATCVMQVVPERISGKAKLGQNKPPADLARILDGLDHRNLPGDRRAVERIREAVPGVGVADRPLEVGFRTVSFGFDQIHRIQPLWEELNRHHHHVATDFRQHFATQTFEKRWTPFADREIRVFAAELENEQLVGYCAASLMAYQGEVDSLYVKANYRRRGLARSLMQLAIEWLGEHGVDRPRLVVAAGNEDVLPFYNRLGFRVRSLTLEKLPGWGRH